MKINYYENGDQTIAAGIVDKLGPEGIDEDVFWSVALSPKLRSSERSILMSDANFCATSKPRGEDSYDKEIGKEIARDKVVVRNCVRELKQYKIIRKYLEDQLDNVASHIFICNKKLDNAEKRLSSH